VKEGSGSVTDDLTRVAIYCRVSSEEQAQSGTIQNQSVHHQEAE
jgi:hypothetical protein